ncbi:MAG: M48 family metalloprotease [Syntrophales bacterium]|nr:M48 family metalloprotease [Syntrophales bacterium]
MKIKNILILSLILVTLFQAAHSYASFTIEDEKKLGKEFYEKLEKNNVLLKNEKVNDYIIKLGNKILEQSKRAPFDFRFSVIKSPAINAFATPGGYVYVNRGLINLVENESQLAGVLAHEIAHVNARHIADTIEKSKKVSIATLAAILAGAFLGGGGQGSAAAAAFSMATATTLNLKYSREHEEEADRLGMSYMVSAGYNGMGMPDFLKIMRRYQFYSNSVPSYFLTHPGTGERISYLDGLLQFKYTQHGAESIIGGLGRIQTLLMFGERNLDTTLKHFQNLLKKNPDNTDALYGLAVTQVRLGLTGESFKNFDKALKLSPDDEDVLKDFGISYFKIGKTSDAIAVLTKAYALDENDADVLLYLGRSYEAAGDYKTSLNLYRKLNEKDPDNINAYYYLAMAYGKANEQGDSHYNFGIYFKKKKTLKSALFHFKAALKYFPKYSEKGREIQKEIESIK